MVQRFQSKSLRLQNQDYKKFIQSVKNLDEKGIKIGEKKGYHIPNNLFIQLLMNEIISTLSGIYPSVRVWQLVDLLDPQDLITYDRKTGATLLDHVIETYSQALKQVDEVHDQDYLVSGFETLLMLLTFKGALVHMPPNKFPENEKFKEIVDKLFDEDEEDEEEDDEEEDDEDEDEE
jgi:hypothetical protein